MALASLDTITGEVTEPNKRKKGNKDFIMLYRQYITQISELGLKDAQALKVLLFLVRNMDTNNAIMITMNLMAEMIGMCRQTVSKKIKYLEANGWICILKAGRENVYVINPDVVWTSYADQQSYCKFDAKVILDSRDNWAILKKDKQSIRHIDKDILNTFYK